MSDLQQGTRFVSQERFSASIRLETPYALESVATEPAGEQSTAHPARFPEKQTNWLSATGRELNRSSRWRVRADRPCRSKASTRQVPTRTGYVIVAPSQHRDIASNVVDHTPRKRDRYASSYWVSLGVDDAAGLLYQCLSRPLFWYSWHKKANRY